MTTKRKSVALGAFLLTLSGLLTKVIGMIYKIPLTNRLGEVGMGYFNTAYTVYTLFFLLSGSGLPTALALLLSRDLAEASPERAERRFRLIRRFSCLLASVLSLLLLVGAKPLACLFGLPTAAGAICAIAPALFFITLTSSYRGYFQAFGNMLPTALSQLIEALGKLLFGLYFLYLALQTTSASERLATASALGLSLGTAFAFLLFLLFQRETKKTISRKAFDDRALFRETLSTALPLTASAMAASFASFLDLLLLMRALLSIGYSVEAAGAAWGNYSALVLPLFHMPQVLLTPIAAAILPAFKASLTRGEKERTEQLEKTALVTTAFLSLASALGLSLFSKEALMLLYRDEAAIAHAYPHLSLLAIAIFPLGIMTVTATLLQAKGHLWVSTVSLVIGTSVKAALTLLLVGLFGEAVAPLGTLIAYSLSAAINLAVLSRKAGHSYLGILLPKPFLTATLSCLAALTVKILFSRLFGFETLATLIAILTAAFCAVLIAALSGMITKDDLHTLGVKR